MIRYVLRRLALAIPTLFGIAVVVFLLVHLAPGSPVSGSDSSLRRTTGRAAEQMRRLYGLDRPLPERFAAWLSRAARFDLGESFVDHRPVSARIREALPNTLAPERARAPSRTFGRDPSRRRGGRPAGKRVRPPLGGGALRAVLDADLLGGAAAPDSLRGQAALAAALRSGFGRGAAGPRRPPGPPGARGASGDVPRLRHARLRGAAGPLGGRRGAGERLRAGVARARSLAAAGDLDPRVPERDASR